MNIDLVNNVLRSLQGSLLGEIYPAMRAVGFMAESLESLVIYACFDREPTEDDIENISVISTLVVADIDFKTVREECYFSKNLCGSFNENIIWVYVRK